MTTNVLSYIDFKRVNTLLESFNKSTGFVTAILDLEGNVLSQSGWRKICTAFHRVNQDTCKNCLISDTQLANMNKVKDFNIYKCLNGLYDVAVPLIIDGEHIANIFTGQFFFEKPSISFFQNQARKYNFDEEIYLKALKEVPIVTEAQVKDIVQFLLNITHIIIDLTTDKIELEYSAYNDYLTGLHNRRYYEENLVKLDVAENYPLTIVMGDINGLKLINDAFGHAMGDELLKSAAKLIADNCRTTDLLARIGGDEFVIVMPNTDERTAEQILSIINEKAKLVKTESILLSISFGHKAKTLASEDVQDIYRSAEDLMYREKLLEIPSMRSSAIETILNTLYEKDEKSEVHSRSVSSLSEKIAIAYGMSRQDVAEVKTSGLLHDIGKIIVPTSIINKIGKLTPEEYSIMKNHPEIGFRILNSTQDMRDISNIVLNHHERWDGKGYPRGIKAEEIPLKSRIISIADAFDAMTSERTYRKSVSKEEALKEIIDNTGTQFDPELVKVFQEHFVDIVVE